MRCARVLAVLLVAVATSPAWAQPAAAPGAVEEDEIEVIEDVDVVSPADLAFAEIAFSRLERVLNVPLARTARARTFVFAIDHRTWAPVKNNPFQDFLGFDSGLLKIGIGLRYGVLDFLDVGVYRLNNGLEAFDTWELDVRGQVLDAAWAYVDVAVRGGVTWFAQPRSRDAVGGFGQLLLSRTFLNRVTVGSGLLFHSESTNSAKSVADQAWSLAVPAALEVRILPWLAWDLEGAYSVAGYGSTYPVLTTAVKFLTNRHTFALVVSNTQYMGADGLVANTERRLDEVIVGFTITREL